MSGNSNTLSATVHGDGNALGDFTATNATTSTFAGREIAFGFASATAFAEATTTLPPVTAATTYGFADGGSITNSMTGHVHFDSPYGLSFSASATSFATSSAHNPLSGHSLAASHYNYELL